jgi:hypothetical protein
LRRLQQMFQEIFSTFNENKSNFLWQIFRFTLNRQKIREGKGFCGG